MKKSIKNHVVSFMLSTVLISIISIIIELVLHGIPLFGIPDAEHITQVEITDSTLHETRIFTDEKSINLARKATGFLRYQLGSVTEENPCITIIYTDDVGKIYKIAANNDIVVYNGKVHRLKDDKTFVKIIEGIFFVDLVIEPENN